MPFSSQDGHCMTLPKYMVYTSTTHILLKPYGKSIWKKLIFTNVSSRENLISLKNNGEKRKSFILNLSSSSMTFLSPIFEILKHGQRNWILLSPFSGTVN